MEVTEDDDGLKLLIVKLARRLPAFPSVYDLVGLGSPATVRNAVDRTISQNCGGPIASGDQFCLRIDELGHHVASGDLSRSMGGHMPKSHVFLFLGLVWWTW